MSPALDGLSDAVVSFPRVSGDEPLLLCQDKAPRGFSPRERG